MSEQRQELLTQLAILRHMLEKLPDTIAQPLLDQLGTVAKAIENRDTTVRNQIGNHLDDIRLSIKTMEFDLESTKAEKQVLKDKLKDVGLE